MRKLFHLSPVENRDSILAHGLDPRRMGATRGLAGSDRPELDGVFVIEDRSEVDWFQSIGSQHANGLDLWEIEADDDVVLQTATTNFEYLPLPVPRERVRLAETFPAARAEPSLPEPVERTGQLGAFIYEFEGDDADDGALVAVESFTPGPLPAFDPPTTPLPGWLAQIADAAVRDVIGASATEAGTVATHVRDTTDPTWADFHLQARDGSWSVRFGCPLEPRGATLEVALATALQRSWIERDGVAETLHPPCPGHGHAAIAQERDDAAWWTCPQDGRLLARLGALR